MAVHTACSRHAQRAALHQLGGVLRNLGFLKRGLDDLATPDVGNVPYTLGLKICMHTVPPEYGEYGGTQRAPLAKCLNEMGYVM